ncbi:hypothetical protein [Gallibacterium anatis]|uniref:Uncharacterized protein n=1 Tax=Gallibacterium anatis TaxID=750 RepID=A0A377H5B4_9PAST|nr:hypothetical protein [Gallibacterium anatis]KGQ24274.1 hypothetical protein JP27_09855 [Gallibacterium anatis]KGQ28236.1 hypothetical protein JP31_02465 [Gallibacterium anatis]KGQ52659.1 hypothetical protein IE01_11740 [Gallibacterium anatis DSM 16844 = F 149]WIM82838.1 hypothetical protein QP019_04095 [Gallibacterium anatis]STO37702.1 Uncharacterised protein [Gallibacterium anatis]
MVEVKEKLLMEQVSNQALFEKLQAVEALLLQQKETLTEDSKELWTVADIAAYFKLSERHIRGAVIVDPLFPRPVEIPSQRDIRKRSSSLRWIAGDVVRYAERKKARRV